MYQLESKKFIDFYKKKTIKKLFPFFGGQTYAIHILYLNTYSRYWIILEGYHICQSVREYTYGPIFQGALLWFTLILVWTSASFTAFSWNIFGDVDSIIKVPAEVKVAKNHQIGRFLKDNWRNFFCLGG